MTNKRDEERREQAADTLRSGFLIGVALAVVKGWLKFDDACVEYRKIGATSKDDTFVLSKQVSDKEDDLADAVAREDAGEPPRIIPEQAGLPQQ